MPEAQPPTTKIMPDSCWLIAYLTKSDLHHTSVQSSFGAIRPYNPVFYVPSFVYMETIATLRRQGKSFSVCRSAIEGFLKHVKHKHQQHLDTGEIIKKYETFSRKKISTLKGPDFYIATEGIVLNAKILTCDSEMHDKVFKYYNEIYFVSDQVPEKPSELSRLISDIQSGR